MHIVLVSGGRGFGNPNAPHFLPPEQVEAHKNLLVQRLDFYLLNLLPEGVKIIHGGAEGADTHAHNYALTRGLPYEVFPPEYHKFRNKRQAPIARNRTMVLLANYVICFWDGKSSGTKSVIDFAWEFDKPLRIVRY